MPFTVSHIAAVLPQQRWATTRWALPTAPLVIGSMAPDLPMFLDRVSVRAETHTVAGIFTIDLAITVVGCLLWAFGLREPVLALAPGLRWRLRVPPPSGRVSWTARWLLAALVGSATHVGWDALTHANTWPTRHLGLLTEPAGPLTMNLWLQYVSSVVGLVVLGLWSLRWWTSTQPRRRVDGEAEVHWRAASAAVLGLLVVGLVVGLRGARTTTAGLDVLARVRVIAGNGALSGGSAVLVALVVVAVAYRLASAAGVVRPSRRPVVPRTPADEIERRARQSMADNSG